MRRSVLAAVVCCLLGLGTTVPGAAAEGKPPVPRGRGEGLGQHAAPLSGPAEGFAAYVPQVSCDPQWRKGLRAFRDLVLTTYPGTQDWGSLRDCTDDGISEHLDGRAWDWHADAKDRRTFAAATDLINWLMAKGPDGQPAYWARRLGIMYIGYNHRIWGAYRAAEGWRKLSPSDPHTDHVHFSFSWQGAMGRTSFWDGTPAAQDYGPCRPFRGEPAVLYTRENRRPCSSPPVLSHTSGRRGTLLWRGSRSSAVSTVQKALGVPVDGYFGASTMRAVAQFQRTRNLPVTGAVDSVTRTRMVTEGILRR